MEKDYYNILEIQKGSSDEEIKKAYMRLAKAYHPDKNKSLGSEEKFKEIRKAYEVLSDPVKKEKYDSQRRRNDSIDVNFFKDFDNDDVIRRFFGNADDFYGHSTKTVSVDDNGNFFFKVQHQKIKNKFSSGYKSSPYKRDKQDKPIRRNLHVPLKNILTGATKKVKVTRTVYDPNGGSCEEYINLTISINKGTKDGKDIVFPRLGDKRPNAIPADIIFTIRIIDHPLFQREGNNLIFSRNIPTLEFLRESQIIVPRLDDESSILLDHHLQTEIIIPNQGLPYEYNPEIRGNLIVKLKVVDKEN